VLVITGAKPQPVDVASRPWTAELGLAALVAFANSGALGVKRGRGPPKKARPNLSWLASGEPRLQLQGPQVAGSRSVIGTTIR
jgi:hypothetical protein